MFRKAISLRSKRQTISHAVAPFHLVVPYFVGNCECPRWRKRKRAIPWYPRAGNVIFRADCSQLAPLPVPVELYNDRLIGRAANNRVRRSQQQLRPDSQPASARLPRKRASRAKRSGKHLIGRAAGRRVFRNTRPVSNTRLSTGSARSANRCAGWKLYRLDKGATIDHGSRMPTPYIGDRLAMEPQKEFLKWKLIGFGRLAFTCRKKVCGDLMRE